VDKIDQPYEYGDFVTISGSGATKSAKITIEIIPPDDSESLELSFFSTSAGDFSTMFLIPDDVTHGTYTILASDSTQSGTTTFFVYTESEQNTEAQVISSSSSAFSSDHFDDSNDYEDDHYDKKVKTLESECGKKKPTNFDGLFCIAIFTIQDTLTDLQNQIDDLQSMPGPQGPIGPEGPQGLMGPDGPQGLMGPDGPQGLMGPDGPQGLIGLTGVTGTQGPIGLTGATGAQGPIGLTGAQGLQGLPGTDGADGATGAQGLQGLPGTDGADGATGAQGLQGLPGTDGADGATGAQGPIGLTGAQGLQGLPGTDGADGATGAQGPIGLTGTQGPIGPAGANSTVPGPQGLIGPEGPQGPPGADADASALQSQIDALEQRIIAIEGAAMIPTISSFKFENNVLDSTGTNHGIVTGNEKYTTGKIGINAFDFDGSTHIELTNESNFDFSSTNSFSASFWIKTTDSDGVNGLVGKMEGSPVFKGWSIDLNSGKISVFLISAWDTSPNEAIQIDTTSSINDGQWHHIGVTYNGNELANGVRIYVDGSIAITTTILDNFPASGSILNNIPLHLGNRLNANTFNGQMDELLIFNKELTASEIASLA